MKPFDTDKMPWLFTPHGDGELNEYFSSDHSKVISETSKEVIASLSESRDRLSGKLCYEFHYNQRRYKYTLLRFADMIVRADVSIKKLKKRIMELDIDNRELRRPLFSRYRAISFTPIITISLSCIRANALRIWSPASKRMVCCLRSSYSLSRTVMRY